MNERRATNEELKDFIVNIDIVNYVKSIINSGGSDSPIVNLVTSLPGFEKLLSEKAKKIYSVKMDNTVKEFFDNDKRYVEIALYMSILIEYNEENQNLRFVKAITKMAEMFNKAAELNVIGHGCLLTLSKLEMAAKEDGTKRLLLTVWPFSNSKDIVYKSDFYLERHIQINELMGEKCFYSEGELPEFQEEIFK